NISALVTGGASGLGLATTRKLLQEGCKVVVCDTNRTSEIDELGNNAVFSETDITSEESVKDAIDLAKSKFSLINCVVNCVGVGISRKVISNSSSKPHDLKEFERVLKVWNSAPVKRDLQINTVGTFNVIRLTALSMAQNEPDEDGGRGVIINTASVSAFEGQVGQVAYAASKAAIVGMTLPVARDLSRHGIRCVTIAPGIFDTEAAIAKIPKGALYHLVKSVPFPNRPGRPEEFADLACCIIENKMLNGTTIRLDGALRLPP
uniref:3-hydroxyacyl-CoA dehydrogenase type-2 n=1 Tax=Hydatigena taeniaeformis TaxID=6205 RepID=A0A0R3WT95_HYDTA